MPATSPALPPTAERSSLRVERLLLVAGSILAALAVGTLLYHVASTVVFPYDLDYGEGYVLNDAVRLAHGQPIYTDIQQFPMVRSPYPPLFPALWSVLVPLAGPVFWPGRLLSALALVGVLGLVVWNARRVQTDGWLPWIAAALVVASPMVYQWAGYARVDVLALLFSVGAVLVAQRSQTPRALLLAVALCSLALWTKQTSVAAPAAITFALLGRSWRRALAFVVLMAAANLIPALLLDHATNGEFARHVMLGNAENPFNVPRMLVMSAVFWILHLPLVVVSVIWSMRLLRGFPSPISFYVLFAFLVALTVGNEGSSVNYFLEPVAAATLALPFVWRLVAPRAHPLALFLVVLQLVMLVRWPNTFGTEYLAVAPHGRTPTAGDYEAGAAVDAAVRAEPRQVLSEAAGFSVRNDRPVYVQPIDLRAEQLHGRWNSGPLIQAIHTGQFPLLVTVYNLLPQDVEQAVAETYPPPRTISSPDGLTFHLYDLGG